MNNMKIIILEYYFLFLLGSFNGENGKFLPLFGKVGENGIGRKEHSFLSIPLKSQIFIPPKLGGVGENEIRFNDFLRSECLDPAFCIFAFAFFSFLFFFGFLTFSAFWRQIALFTGPTTTLFRKNVLKIGPTVLFTHLKIILLQCFQQNKLYPNRP